MFFSETSSYEILKIIGKLKNKYSAGLDEFPDCLLKTCAPAIIHPLTYIFNASLCSGIFPHIFKTAKMKPLFKKRQRKWNSKLSANLSFVSFFQNIKVTFLCANGKPFSINTTRFKVANMDS